MSQNQAVLNHSAIGFGIRNGGKEDASGSLERFSGIWDREWESDTRWVKFALLRKQSIVYLFFFKKNPKKVFLA